MKYAFLFTLVILFIVPSTFAILDITETKCMETGQLEVKVAISEKEGRTYTENMGIELRSMDINQDYYIPTGTWDKEYVYHQTGLETEYVTFTTPEMFITTDGTYRVRVEEKDTDISAIKTITCPGLIFSCNMFSIEVLECNTYDGLFTATIQAEGFSDDKTYSTMQDYTFSNDVLFNVRTKERYCDKNGLCSSEGGLPEDATITYAGNHLYELEWQSDGNDVETLGVEIKDSNDCQTNPKYEKQNFFSNKICTSDPLYENEELCEGCETADGVCIPAESVIKQSGVMKYCTPYGKLLSQKRLSVGCKYDYECKTGYCDSVCTEEPTPLSFCEENQVLLGDCKCGTETYLYVEGDEQYCCEGILSLQSCFETGQMEPPEIEPGQNENGPEPEQQEDTPATEEAGIFKRFFTWLANLF